MSTEMPLPLMTMGAVSRLEPEPKLMPATITSPGRTFLEKSGSAPSMACWII